MLESSWHDEHVDKQNQSEGRLLVALCIHPVWFVGPQRRRTAGLTSTAGQQAQQCRNQGRLVMPGAASSARQLLQPLPLPPQVCGGPPTLSPSSPWVSWGGGRRGGINSVLSLGWGGGEWINKAYFTTVDSCRNITEAKCEPAICQVYDKTKCAWIEREGKGGGGCGGLWEREQCWGGFGNKCNTEVWHVPVEGVWCKLHFDWISLWKSKMMQTWQICTLEMTSLANQEVSSSVLTKECWSRCAHFSLVHEVFVISLWTVCTGKWNINMW